MSLLGDLMMIASCLTFLVGFWIILYGWWKDIR